MATNPPVPVRTPIDPAWPHAALHERVKEALAALPAHFNTEILIAGIMATDLHTLNQVLGATIEDQVVATLNSMHRAWDPDEQYTRYSFVRQPQTFPDVLLRRAPSVTPAEDILMGIELKGWYLLAKEGEPNFRFAVTPAVCNPQDLLVVVPWALSQVISGRPVVFAPYVDQARFVAEARNHHWKWVRETAASREIALAADVAPYPIKSDKILDVPAADVGGNFGRFARTEVMDPYVQRIQDHLLSGIKVRHWLTFFKAFQERASETKVRKVLAKLVAKISEEAHDPSESAEALQQITEGIQRLLDADE